MNRYPVMDKKLILLPILLLFQFVGAQEVRFTEGKLPNGLVYPITEYTGNKQAQNTLNNNIFSIVSNYNDQDYCIGQFGYVQQTSYLQIHFYFNCIDLDESKNEYHLFNLLDGQPCAPSDMFLDKQKNNFQAFFQMEISNYLTKSGKGTFDSNQLGSLTIDDFEIQLLEKGILVLPKSEEHKAIWGTDKLNISWSSMRPYLKTTFI
jgi:hypothetical protein